MPTASVNYRYRSIPVPGGGFVTGFVFHPTVPNILYCRTDIGGCYRYDFDNNAWISLIDHATDPNVWETYPLSIALDPHNPSYVYAMVGRKPTSKIAFSDDYGAHWTYFEAPADIHGNAPGRSTGERLVVDPDNSNRLYLGSMEDGLWRTDDGCRTWSRVKVAAPGKESELQISFIAIHPAGGWNGDEQYAVKRIVVGTSGRQGSPDGNTRGQSVYISHDNGETFVPLAGEPAPVLGGPTDHPGYVGQRAVFAGDYLFISYSAYNVGWSKWHTYGCDLGKCYDGALFRYRFDGYGNVIEALDVTPPNINQPEFRDPAASNRRLGYGLSGISADRQVPGTLICSTITVEGGTLRVL